MMKTRLISTFSLIVLLLASCAPATVPTKAEVTQAIVSSPSAEATATQPAPSADPTATQPPTVEIQPVATSRGPDLEATDPSTVSLASGGLQLVEFFRFT